MNNVYIWISTDEIKTMRYTDKRLTDDTKIPGFGSLFKTAPDNQKFYAYFPNVAGGIRSEEEWIAYFNKIRKERFDHLTEIKSKNAFYRFLKHDLEGDEYYYCLPRGFTKSEAIALGIDQEILKTLEGKTVRFERLRKLTESIGICEITQV